MVASHDAQLIERVAQQNMLRDFPEETCLTAARHTRLAAFTLHTSSDFRAPCTFTTRDPFTWHLFS